MRTIIIGGVAAGMSAATRLRRLDEQREIVVFERGAHVSFANCGLPYYVGGVIADRSSLLLQTPASLAARFALRVHVRHEVTAIDAASKVVTVRDLDDDVRDRLRQRAAAHGRSMEAEARAILAASVTDSSWLTTLIEVSTAYTAQGPDLEQPERDLPREVTLE